MNITRWAVLSLFIAGCASQPPPKVEITPAEAPDAAVALEPAPPPPDPHTDPVDTPPVESDASEPEPSTQAPPSAPRHIPTREELAARKAEQCVELRAEVQTAGSVSVTARLRARGTYRDDDIPRFEAQMRKALPAGAVTGLRVVIRGLPTWSMTVTPRALEWLCKNDDVQSVHATNNIELRLYE